MSQKIIKMPVKGFSLTELLIALLIIGQIAAFAIPKILTAQEDSQRKAVMRETYATLNQIFYNISNDPNLSGSTALGPAVSKELNYVKYCPSNTPVTDGCWTAAMGDPGSQTSNYVSFVLHNGAYVLGIGNNTNDSINGSSATALDTYFAIDWNGPAGPNTVGEDQITLQYCFKVASTNCSNIAGNYSGPIQKGLYPTNATTLTLFEKIFTR